MTYPEVIRKLTALGCHEIPWCDSGSHRKWFNRGLVIIVLG